MDFAPVLNLIAIRDHYYNSICARGARMIFCRRGAGFKTNREPLYYNVSRAGGRAVDLGGLSVYQGGQSLKLSAKVAVFKKLSLKLGARPPLGAGPEHRPKIAK